MKEIIIIIYNCKTIALDSIESNNGKAHTQTVHTRRRQTNRHKICFLSQNYMYTIYRQIKSAIRLTYCSATGILCNRIVISIDCIANANMIVSECANVFYLSKKQKHEKLKPKKKNIHCLFR